MKIQRISILKPVSALMLAAVFFLGNQPLFAQLVCNPVPMPTVVTGSITGADQTQNGRTNRNGIVGSCPTGKTNTLFASTVLNRDAHDFTNPTGMDACVTVDVDHTGCGGSTNQVVAYSVYDPLNPGNNIIGDFGFSTTGVASFGFPVAAGASFTIVVHEIVAGTGCPVYKFTVSYNTSCRSPGFDVGNDGKADLGLFGTTGIWNIKDSDTGMESMQSFGLSGDVPTAGDYTGDGVTDVSVRRPGNNTWYYGNNSVNPGTDFTAQPFGIANDVATPGDYDGDSIADIAIWRPSDGNYYVLRSSDSALNVVHFGRNGDTPVIGDFDGDLKTDFVVVRPDKTSITPDYNWYMLNSNFAFGFALATRFGTVGDIPVPGDYDGNGKADIAIFRPSDGSWWINPSVAQNAVSATLAGASWGTSGDIPQPADYDGDGTADIAVYRPSNGTWYIRNSSSGAATVTAFGVASDKPVTAPYPVN